MWFDRQPVSLRAGLCRTVAAATALALATAGCSYHSTYVAPPDGRARVVWGRGDVPLMELSGTMLSGECEAQLRTDIDSAHPPRPVHVEVNSVPLNYVSTGSGYWSPRYYGPPIIVSHPGFAPPFPRFPIFVPRPAVPAPMGGHPISIGSSSSGLSHGTGGVVRSGGGGGGGGSFGGGKDAGVIVLILAVITATVLPAVALGLAASTPESASKSANAIDMVNAYNDLARRDGTPCTPAPFFAPYPPPQEQPR